MRDAYDVVIFVDSYKQKAGEILLGHLTFREDEPLHLYQLARLAMPIHNSQMCYKLLSQNRF